MSDILSQEQIDALLASDQFGTEAPVDSTAQSPSVDRSASIMNFFQLFCSQAGTVISTVVNKKTTFTPQESQKADFAIIHDKVSTIVLSLQMSFKSGLEGDFYIIIGKKDVAVLSDLMTMGDGSAEYSEDHKDAISELFNQVMGAFSNTLGSDIGTTVSAGGVVVSEFDFDNPPFTADSFDMLMTSLSLEGISESQIAFLIPESLSDQIIKSDQKPAESDEISDQVGLSMPELDDLSKVTSFNSSESNFKETSLAGEPLKDSNTTIDMLLDIELDVSIELGRSLMSIKRVLELAPGSIVELDRMAGEPVDLMVNNKVVAKGEVVVIDESFGIRIVSLVSAEERIKSLR